MPWVSVVGGGLAGSEAAWQAAELGCDVRLYEMRPGRPTPAHRTAWLAELVCSNSLRGAGLQHAAGVLKEELRRSGSLILRCADEAAVPAGTALAVDRDRFAQAVTEAVAAHPRIELRREAVDELPAGVAVIATGPLTSPELATRIQAFTGEDNLAYYDAAAPIVAADSIDWDAVFRASRYGRGEGDEYVNCPMNKVEYETFREVLLHAEGTPREPFDPVPYFEGCLPIEEMARRGRDTMRYGPLKPVGLKDPRSGRQPYAVVQLRAESRAASLYNLVGFQTSLRWGEQQRVFRLIPGLRDASFERFGVMHRNLFLNAPNVLLPTLQARRRPDLFFAGQLTGVEGYVESTAGGLVAGINAARLAQGQAPLHWPPETVIGSLLRYITEADPRHFQPMNAAFGLLPPDASPLRDKQARRRETAARALAALDAFRQEATV